MHGGDVAGQGKGVTTVAVGAVLGPKDNLISYQVRDNIGCSADKGESDNQGHDTL